MEEIYFNLSKPGGFAGQGAFQQNLKDEGIKKSNKDVVKWLKNQPTYARHMPANWSFKRRRIITTGILDLLEMDLIG